ncbi:hypothetical protein C2845_PM13G18560 [Panicum miliaceum]|uniref:Receptor-like protein 12 n=1 Tax=Panicum miliaceum TaxID=4540 RepID=A0A3L6RLT0_PANMI|nr:hypothetical protein C2845_PM13G18560 [Panicum miliaceum]
MVCLHHFPSYLLLVIVILATSGGGASLCHQDQSAALLRLKASFRFPDRLKLPIMVSIPRWKSFVVEERFVEFSSLSVLSLRRCALTRTTFPSWIFRIKILTKLDVSWNENLRGELPEFIKGSALQKLRLAGTKFSGKIPESMGNLRNLIVLDLSNCQFLGPIPSFSQGPMISWVDLSVEDGNHSYTEYPTIWSYLGLASCNLSYVPKFLMHQRSIPNLDLSSNNIGGKIPDWIWGIGGPFSLSLNPSHNLFTSVATNLSNRLISILDLHSNKIEGALPLPPWGTYLLDYSNNHFNSSIMPEFWSRISSTTSLSLANNSLIGEVSHLICSATEIEVLDLSFNNFSGTIPPCLLKHKKRLEILNLRGYRPYYRDSVTVTLKGQETTLVQILSVFMSLDLSNNNFEGVIPKEIGDLKFLKGLNLSRNFFTGEIPPRIANMLQLESLDLSCNQLSGEIPAAMALMSFLEVLNLSYNHLSGQIPQASQFLTFPNTSFLGNNRLRGKPLTRLCETNRAPSAAATPGSSKELNWEFLSVEVGVVSGLAIVAATMLLWGNGRSWVYWHVDKFWLQVLQPWICRRRR